MSMFPHPMEFKESALLQEFGSPSGSCVGIDVAHLLSELEYLPIVDVLPAEHLQRVTSVVDWLLESNKSVRIVFDGLVDNSRFRRPVIDNGLDSDETTPAKLDRLFPNSRKGWPTDDTLNALFIALVDRYRDRNEVLVMRAPYFAWAQLAALLHENQITDIIGPLEMFVFPNVKRILLTFVGDEFTVATLESVRTLLMGKTQSQMVRQLSQHPYIANQPFPFVLYSPVFSSKNGSISLVRIDEFLPAGEPLPASAAPYFGDFFGRNIWSSNRNLIVQMSTGLLPVAVVRAIIYGERLIEGTDPNPGHTLYLPLYPTFIADQQGKVCFERFKMALNFMHPLLVQIAYQVIDKFRPTQHQGGSRPPEIKLDEWDLQGWQPDHLPYWLTYLELTGVRARPNATYSDSVAANFAIRLKVLDLMGYFTHAMNSDAFDDSGLSSFAWALKQCHHTNACPGVLFIEACRTGMMVGDSFLVKRDGSQHDVPPTHTPALLGARIMSLMPLRRTKVDQPGQPWNMNVVAFSNVARLSFNVLQQLNLVMTVNTLTGLNGLHPSEITPAQIFDNLIFKEPPTPHMGLVAYRIFALDESWTIEKLQRTFPEATNLIEDLEEAAKFFCTAYKMAVEMMNDDSGIESARLEEIKNAYHYCSERLRAFSPNFAEACPDMINYLPVRQ